MTFFLAPRDDPYGLLLQTVVIEGMDEELHKIAWGPRKELLDNGDWINISTEEPSV